MFTIKNEYTKVSVPIWGLFNLTVWSYDDIKRHRK